MSFFTENQVFLEQTMRNSPEIIHFETWAWSWSWTCTSFV